MVESCLPQNPILSLLEGFCQVGICDGDHDNVKEKQQQQQLTTQTKSNTLKSSGGVRSAPSTWAWAGQPADIQVKFRFIQCLQHLIASYQPFQSMFMTVVTAMYQTRCCIHERDWAVGEFIPFQIVDSVNQSRRTLIIISPEYSASKWTMMEFKCAHSRWNYSWDILSSQPLSLLAGQRLTRGSDWLWFFPQTR